MRAFAVSVLVGLAPTQVHAKLTPIPQVRDASGTFAASAVQSKSTVKMTWRLSVSHLSGPPTKATLRIAGLGVTFVLCRPCSATGHGQVGFVSAVWDRLLRDGGQVVVATRAHPKGELRGTVSRG